MAQEPLKSDDKPIPTVEVKAAKSDCDPRRDDTASKTVINQDELVKYGDTNVYDVLKRAPGVTVTGNTIRMRGLGAGYTQILVNGERPPPGFSLDNLPPDQIERIEIMRAATAEFSMQAIAGTVNIVLKKSVAKPQRDVRLSARTGSDSRNGVAGGTLADKIGNLSWFVTANLTRDLNDPETDGGDSLTAANGVVTQQRTNRSVAHRASIALFLAPRLNWKLANDDQITVSGFAQDVHSGDSAAGTYSNNIGSFGTPDYVDRLSANTVQVHFGALDVNWVARIGGGKLDAKVGVNGGAVAVDGVQDLRTADAATRLVRDNDLNSRYLNFVSSGKYTRALGQTNSLATGWETSRRTTREHPLRADRLDDTAAVVTDERFDYALVRLAAFAQDEWNITKEWSMYLGARWEGIRTDSGGTGAASAQSSNHVLSPVAQTLYKFPDKSGRQLRMALTRTFKAPDALQFSRQRYHAPINTRFTPDSSGNPDLQPELATGIDLTYEHFWAPGALFSVGGAARHITGYIHATLRQEADGMWLTSPVNDGDVQVRTLEMEVKLPLKLVWKEAPAVDLRTSVNRNWSRVDAVPGPDNRLDAQIPLSAVLGIDYRKDKLSAGSNLSFRSGGAVRSSVQQSSQQYRRRDLDAYLLYRFTPQWQLRVSASNIFGEDTRTLSRYQDGDGTSESWSRAFAAPRLQAGLEIKL